ncbi:alpha/beta fold hydrolase [Ferrovibrio sp.]|uniref:alpha/beta fold hydrolase n=1 Tax=Ferrovibrio sp. TaxID=1917215 RepID=UPI003D0989B4
MQKLTSRDGKLTAVQTGAGPDLLILHSLLTDHTAFDPVLPKLAEKFRVTLVNLPGFHGSAPIPAGIDGYADRIATVFDDFALGQDCVVMGNGFGGTVAVAMALRHGARFGKMVLSDVAAGFPEQGKVAFRVMAEKVGSEGLGGIVDIAARRVFHDAYLAKHPEAFEERRQVLLGIDPQAFIAACQSLIACDLVPQLGSIGNASLVVVGELDAATPPVLCRQLAAGIPGAWLTEIPQCGHCPPLEMPDVFIETVRGFLAL